jgi:hypothetical protein
LSTQFTPVPHIQRFSNVPNPTFFFRDRHPDSAEVSQITICPNVFPCFLCFFVRISVLYILTYILLQRQLQKHHVFANTDDDFAILPPPPQTSQVERLELRQQRAVFTTMSLIFIIYGLFWFTPFMVGYLN